MKYYYSIIFLLIMANGVLAQKITFSDTTNKWNVKFSTLGNARWGGDNYLLKFTAYGIAIDTLTYQQLDNVSLIREDTAGGKVYVKLLSQSPDIDTTEQVLYDYNLKVGDTIRKRYKLKDTTEHYVQKIDSVLINNVYHRVWYMQHFKPMVGLLGYSYWVIEGIGSLNGPLYPLKTTGFEHHYSLFCFENNNTLVTVPGKQNIGIPTYRGDILSPAGCALTIDKTEKKDTDVSIIPHPANSHSNFNLPYSVQLGEVILYNAIGQIFSGETINNQQLIPVSRQKLNSGIYYYRITDKQLGKSWFGKLVYQ